MMLEGMPGRRRAASNPQGRTAQEAPDERRQAEGLSRQSRRYETPLQPCRNKALAGANLASLALPYSPFNLRQLIPGSVCGVQWPVWR